MGGGTGGGTSHTSQAATIAPELQPFFKATGERAEAFQGAAPLAPFISAQPPGVAPLSGTERAGITATRTLADRPTGETQALARIGQIPGIASQQVDPSNLAELSQRRVDPSNLAELSQRRIDLSPSQALAARRVGGAGIENAPAIQAARLAFRTGAQPNITSQLALRGLGRSTAAAPALARAEAEFLYPAIQDELGREERRIARELGVATTGLGLQERGLEREVAAEQAGMGLEERGLEREVAAEQAGMGLEERGIQRELEGALGAAPLQLAAGRQESARELAAVEAQLRAGGLERGVDQAALNAQQQDFLRRQALSEQALFGPLGSVLPSAIGQTKTTKMSDTGGK